MLRTKKINKGAALWKKAKTLIPGGNQLLSKRSEMFLPDQWPAYYKKAKGCEIWDLDDRPYYDMSIMGIGSSPLGYAHEAINAAVHRAIDEGNMTTLNCPQEVELAQKLVDLHPWGDMARFARTGGEACAIAVRIARAFTQKDKIAFCGYHGWHDWYLAANLSDSKNLDQLLLPGLSPVGVPQHLKGSAIPFYYGDAQAFKELVQQHKADLGVVIMEVARHSQPDLNFLRTIREMTRDMGIVLIYDEISSGFRLNTGGLHLLYDLQPDMTVLGKALGNGHPISAILGREKVMQAAQETFISSTYWTERTGYAAAFEVLKIYEREAVPQQLIKQGNKIRLGLEGLFKKHQLNIEIEGLASNPILIFKDKDGLLIKSVYTQEMLKRGFLASSVIYVSIAHTDKIIDLFLVNADEVFGCISAAMKGGQLASLLKGPVCHSGFKRLN